MKNWYYSSQVWKIGTKFSQIWRIVTLSHTSEESVPNEKLVSNHQLWKIGIKTHTCENWYHILVYVNNEYQIITVVKNFAGIYGKPFYYLLWNVDIFFII